MRIEDGSKRVRAVLGGAVVADTLRPRLVWENPHYPHYWLPERDVRLDRIPEAAVRRDDHHDGLKGHVRLDWAAMDHWFEEDEEVFVHPRSPFTRVDILASSRHVEVEVDGVVVASSRQPRLLFETGLPTRYYLPLTDVRLDLLRPSDTVTHCPYKGSAAYWSVEVGGKVHRDLAWTYRSPLPESQKIAGLVAFWSERVTIRVDGVEQVPSA
jgi:uncharacterized protein (DUF427 family)